MIIRLRYYAAAVDLLLLAHLTFFCCFSTVRASNLALLPGDEVEALRQIAKTLNKYWNFSVDPCSGESGWVYPYLSKEITNSVLCNCSYSNNTVCHVTQIILKQQSLRGSLPAAMAQLPYLEVIDLTRNYLNGTIPVEWATLPLTNISLLGNRLSGDVPPWIGNLTTLVDLTLEANQFTGQLPAELAKLFNLKKLQLSSNKFSGNLPSGLANLAKIEQFRINDNRFNGKIPEWMQNWTNLKVLELQASGLEGPIPSGIFSLTDLTDLMVSDVNETMSFPQQISSNNLKRLILRNCGLSGNIPDYIGNLKLKQLDLSFNNLIGAIPTTLQNLRYSAKFMFLNRNKLSGPVQDWMFNSQDIDLSYNNLTWTGHNSSCQQTKLNLVGNSYEVDKLRNLTRPCLELIQCYSSQSSLHINCGGDRFTENNAVFEEDTDPASASKFFLSANMNWAFSSTGTYQDNNDDEDQYIATSSFRLSMPDTGLYDKARISPVSLTYYGLCLVEGNYTVKLHFAEIAITNNEDYSSVGERIFDIYIQESLVLKDFNIRNEANGSGIAIQKLFNVTVTDGKLEIHLYWAGKGTEVIPNRGTYGPLISAISVENNFPQHSRNHTKISVAIITSVSFVMFLLVGILWKKGCFGGKTRKDQELEVLNLQTGRFTLRQIKIATDNFSTSNKIGEGGFGPVYKGLLSDGTAIAVKQLSSKSKQGNREFLNEIGMISALLHPNLVKLHGCCIEGNQLLLVYEYMENNSLARALFGSEEHQLKLDWATRMSICVGIAKGLAYIHEESRLKVVHRDIKATNILLDKDLNAKISDFGLAKLDEDENSHISTRIAGTIGYMAPEYATRGYLTEKADVYSFGVVVLEITSGKSVTGFIRDGNMPLLDWVQILRDEGKLAKLIDPRLQMEFDEEEAIRVINVALLCIASSPSSRPTMSAAVSMLEGQTSVVEVIPEQNSSSNDTVIEGSSTSCRSAEYSQTKGFLVERSATTSTKSESDLYPVNLDSYYWSQR